MTPHYAANVTGPRKAGSTRDSTPVACWVGRSEDLRGSGAFTAGVRRDFNSTGIAVANAAFHKPTPFSFPSKLLAKLEVTRHLKTKTTMMQLPKRFP